MSLSRFFGPELSVFRHPQHAGILTSHLFNNNQASGLVFPKLDYITDADQIKINMEVPGVEKKDVDITLNGDTLTISGQVNSEVKEDDKDSQYKLFERSFGSFSRSVQVPSGLKQEDIKAKMDNGLLSIELPKKTEQTEAKRIEIN